MTTGFFSWRWAPAVALVGGATALVIAASVFIPRSIGVKGATPPRVPVTERNDDALRVSADEVEATVTKGAPRRRAERVMKTSPAAGVESFFSAAPEVAELPPPLPDDPVPPEPVNTAANRDAFGPGVEPPSLPPP